MKLSDYVINFFVEKNIDKIFGIAGGASLHLLDSITNNINVNLICNHHEQHSSMAADAYARATKNFGVVVATSGPGATNLITGVCGAYYDSVPLFCVTGQVSTWRQVGSTGVRQIGFQETPVVDMFKSITKYSIQLDKPENIRFELEKAFHIMSHGRLGPVLIDIPDNFQRAIIDISNLRSFEDDLSELEQETNNIHQIIENYNKSERPVIILGAGASRATLNGKLNEFLDTMRCPVVTTWGASDFLSHDTGYNVGNFGTHGNRLANFVVQNSDFILSIGARLDTKATGTPIATFARNAFKVMVDIDKNELNKFSHFDANIELKVCADSRAFIDEILRYTNSLIKKNQTWIDQINEWRPRLSAIDQELRAAEGSSHVYNFFNDIGQFLDPKSAIVSDTGCALAWLMQTFKFEKDQKFFHDYNNTAMGWSLPAVTGIFHTKQFRQINCFIGDGSFMMSVQELSVIKHFNIPVNIFLLNNSGYSMIKQTQDQWLGSKYAGSDASTDLTFPNFASIASSFGIEYQKIDAEDDKLGVMRKNFLSKRAPKLIEVIVDSNARVIPQVKFGRPNEDMEPLLDDNVFSDFMLIQSMRQVK
jgi:acetolactate synthase-1/2/3 large subunit